MITPLSFWLYGRATTPDRLFLPALSLSKSVDASAVAVNSLNINRNIVSSSVTRFASNSATRLASIS
jgi:hypothetical protein